MAGYTLTISMRRDDMMPTVSVCLGFAVHSSNG